MAGTTALLIGSNVFMTFAWYGHLRWLDHCAWYLAVLVPVAISLFGVRFRWDFVWAGLCLVGAVFFAFRGGVGTTG